MVLFTTKFFRKLFYSKFSSIYVNKIVKLLMRQQSDDNTELRDDDLRGNSVLFPERMGIYDGLSTIYKVPKTGTTINYWAASFPDKGFIGGWWIFDEAFHNFNRGGIGYGTVRDRSYFDRHARVYGFPCIVSGGPNLTLPWRTSDYIPALVTRTDGETVGYRVTDHADFRVANGSFSYAFWLYPFDFENSNEWTRDVIVLNGDEAWIDFQTNTTDWSKTLGTFSVAFWFKPTDDPYTQTYRNVLNLSDENDILTIYYDQASKQLAFEVTKDNYGTFANVFTNKCNTLNKWYHIVLTYNSSLGSNNLKVYIDGNFVGQATYAFSLAFASTARLTAGRYFFDTLGEFHMAMDMKTLFWWDGTELTQAAVTGLYNGTLSSVPGASEDFNFFEGEGSITEATSGGDANLLNGAYWNYQPDFPQIGNPNNQKIITKSDDGSNDYAFWVETDGRFNVKIEKAAVEFKARMTSNLVANTWVHIVVTWDTSTNTIKIYKDKVDVTTTTTSSTDYNDSSLNKDLWFLTNNQRQGCFHGAIYEIIFEKGGAMSQTEVNQLYDNRSAAMGNHPTNEPPAWVNYAIAQ